MAQYEDVHIQLVDAPPITADYAPPGLVNTYRSADMLGIVIDLAGEVLQQMEVCMAYLDSHKLILDDTDEASEHLGRKTFVIATKSDIAPDGTLDTLKELTDWPFEYIEISSETHSGLDGLMRRMFEMLDVIRIYAKKPHQPADMTDPFTLKRGSDVHELA